MLLGGEWHDPMRSTWLSSPSYTGANGKYLCANNGLFVWSDGIPVSRKYIFGSIACSDSERDSVYII